MKGTVALHTLGCKLNFSETTSIGRLLEKEGYVQAPFDQVADYYVINTCSVTDNADKECRQIVRRINRMAPHAMVVVTGCYAQLKPGEVASIPGVNLVLGAGEKFRITEHLRELNPNDPTKICSCDIEDVNQFISGYSVNERTRVFLKVQDGCDYSCSFCTIPMARGKSRSGSIRNVMHEVEEISKKGVKEIVLTGINLGDFGKGISGGRQREESFFELVRELEERSPVNRIRISSIEPNLLTDEMIYFISGSNKFMPHFHIPLQSGSNKVLGDMRRRYRTELYAQKIGLIKTLIPDCGIGADVIAGFPGETEDDFRQTMEFISSLEITYLHVFTYSERNNTDAINIKPAVPITVRNERNKLLRALSHSKTQEFIRSQEGIPRPVLFESMGKNGMMEGYTDNYIRVTVPNNKDWENQVIDWTI